MDKRYQSILVICLGFVSFYFAFHKDWLLYAALSLGVLSLLSTYLTDLMLRLWFNLGSALGYVNSKILLSFVFLFIFMPMSIVYRLSKSRSINLKKSGGSYFLKKEHSYSRKDFENPW